MSEFDAKKKTFLILVCVYTPKKRRSGIDRTGP